jgi:hypothetical protein
MTELRGKTAGREYFLILYSSGFLPLYKSNLEKRQVTFCDVLLLSCGEDLWSFASGNNEIVNTGRVIPTLTMEKSHGGSKRKSQVVTTSMTNLPSKQGDRKEYTKQAAIWYKQNFTQIDTYIRNKMTAVAKNQQKQKSLKKSEQEINKQVLRNTKGRNGALKIAPNSGDILSAAELTKIQNTFRKYLIFLLSEEEKLSITISKTNRENDLKPDDFEKKRKREDDSNKRSRREVNIIDLLEEEIHNANETSVKKELNEVTPSDDSSEFSELLYKRSGIDFQSVLQGDDACAQLHLLQQEVISEIHNTEVAIAARNKDLQDMNEDYLRSINRVEDKTKEIIENAVLKKDNELRKIEAETGEYKNDLFESLKMKKALLVRFKSRLETVKNNINNLRRVSHGQQQQYHQQQQKQQLQQQQYQQYQQNQQKQQLQYQRQQYQQQQLQEQQYQQQQQQEQQQQLQQRFQEYYPVAGPSNSYYNYHLPPITDALFDPMPIKKEEITYNNSMIGRRSSRSSFYTSEYERPEYIVVETGTRYPAEAIGLFDDELEEQDQQQHQNQHYQQQQIQQNVQETQQQPQQQSQQQQQPHNSTQQFSFIQWNKRYL